MTLATPHEVKSHPPWLGGCAAMLSVCITHPVDQTKVRSQVQYPKLSMRQTAKNTLRNSGVLGLWVGLSGSLVRQATYGSARFGVYNILKDRDRRNGKEGRGRLVMNGALAGVVAGVVGSPGELVMVRMCSDGVKKPEKRFGYKNAIEGLVRLVREEGVGSIMRGWGATTTRSVIMNGSQLSSYDLIKARLLSTGYFHDNPILHMTTAVSAGTLAVTLCAPVDVMKSRIQSSTQPGITATTIVSDSLRREGFAVLFRGWLPAWLRMTPTTMLTFMFFEQLKQVF